MLWFSLESGDSRCQMSEDWPWWPMDQWMSMASHTSSWMSPCDPLSRSRYCGRNQGEHGKAAESTKQPTYVIGPVKRAALGYFKGLVWEQHQVWVLKNESKNIDDESGWIRLPSLVSSYSQLSKPEVSTWRDRLFVEFYRCTNLSVVFTTTPRQPHVEFEKISGNDVKVDRYMDGFIDWMTDKLHWCLEG